jgi:hypothetical protein
MKNKANNMKKILLIIGFLLTSQSFSAPPAIAYCAADKVNFNGDNNCISTCSAIAESSVRLASGESGACTGQASYSEFDLYEIALGRDSAGSEPLCTIWSGDATISTASTLPGTSENFGIIDLSTCPSGSYDVVHLTASRFNKYAGFTKFPDSSGSIVRTTSTFANDTAGYENLDDWLESSTSHSDDTKGYVRPSTGWTAVYNKLSSTPSAENLNGETDKTMLLDWVKIMKVGDTAGTDLPGWFCDGVDSDSTSMCTRAVGADKLEYRSKQEIGYLEGFPLIIADGDVTLSAFDISYTSSVRGDTEEAGVLFLWHNDGGTLKYLGSRPHDDGLYITFGTPQPNGGL